MAALDEAAQEIADALHGEKVEKKVAFDPMTILVIIQIIGAVIKAFQECKKTPAQAVSEVKSLGIIERWRLRRFIKQKIDDPEVHEHLGPRLFSAFSQYGAKLTEEKIAKIYSEVK